MSYEDSLLSDLKFELSQRQKSSSTSSGSSGRSESLNQGHPQHPQHPEAASFVGSTNSGGSSAPLSPSLPDVHQTGFTRTPGSSSSRSPAPGQGLKSPELHDSTSSCHSMPRTLSKKEMDRIEFLAKKQQESERQERLEAERLRAQREILARQSEGSYSTSIGSLDSLSHLVLSGMSSPTSTSGSGAATQSSAPSTVKASSAPTILAPIPATAGMHQHSEPWSQLSLDAIPPHAFAGSQHASLDSTGSAGHSRRVQVVSPPAEAEDGETKAKRVQSLENQLDMLVESGGQVSVTFGNSGNEAQNPLGMERGSSSGRVSHNIPSTGSNSSQNSSSSFNRIDTRAARRSTSASHSANNSVSSTVGALDVPTLPSGALSQFNNSAASSNNNGNSASSPSSPTQLLGVKRAAPSPILGGVNNSNLTTPSNTAQPHPQQQHQQRSEAVSRRLDALLDE